MSAKPNNAKSDAPKKWPDWSGETVVIIATGPSLTAEDVALVHQYRKRDLCKVIAINEAGLRRFLPLAAPWADVLYAADRDWWSYYKPSFMGWRISGEFVQDVHTRPLKMLEREEPMPHTPGEVVSGGHSGFQALGLALSCGAARIALLGMDCGGGHYRNCHANRHERFARDVDMGAWAEFYNRVSREFPGVAVVNCSMISRISAFVKIPLGGVLWFNE